MIAVITANLKIITTDSMQNVVNIHVVWICYDGMLELASIKFQCWTASSQIVAVLLRTTEVYPEFEIGVSFGLKMLKPCPFSTVPTNYRLSFLSKMVAVFQFLNYFNDFNTCVEENIRRMSDHICSSFVLQTSTWAEGSLLYLMSCCAIMLFLAASSYRVAKNFCRIKFLPSSSIFVLQ